MTAETGTEMTDWFPADVKPVHVGAYEAYYGYPDDTRIPVSAHSVRWWNGEKWLCCEGGLPAAFGQKHDKWRGLRNKP
jgi:hypothetical protein